MRVESRATVPKRPNSRAISTTCVNTSFSARPLPPPQRAQRPVIRPLPTRQIAQPQILPDTLLQPPRTCHPQRIGVEPSASTTPHITLRLRRCRHFRTPASPTPPPRGAETYSEGPRPTRLSRWAAADRLDPGCTAEIVTYLFTCLISSPKTSLFSRAHWKRCATRNRFLRNLGSRALSRNRGELRSRPDGASGATWALLRHTPHR